MGIEDFRVRLGDGSTTFAQAHEAVRELPHARPDPGGTFWPDCNPYLVGDGRHVIEALVSPSPVDISCRFVLCNPPSVDEGFLDLVNVLMTRLGMEVWNCEALTSADEGPFPVTRFSAFADAVRPAIARRRAEWVAEFGSEQFPATTREAFETVILPRCVPGVR